MIGFVEESGFKFEEEGLYLYSIIAAKVNI
jgi:hypothetical protein